MRKKTTFHKAHQELNGRLVEFFGWELPVQYSGVREEHLAVRNRVGVFDVSHMGEIFVSGKEAREAVQYITSNDVGKLTPGGVQYSTLPTPSGCIVDDILVYMFDAERYLLVVNAANVEKDFAWIRDHTRNFAARVVNESDHYSQLAIQGPRAEELVRRLVRDPARVTALSYYTFTEDRCLDLPAIVSRTGYTGEDGFELYFQDTSGADYRVLLDIIEEGRDLGILPAGLGARDTLRLESKMALYGNDIDESHTILEAGLKWILKLKKGDFIGREALLKQKEEGITRKLAGFEMTGRGIARPGYPVWVEDREVDRVTSGTYSPTLQKAIGLAYLPVGFSKPDTPIEIGIRNRKVPARVVKTPFYKRKS